MSSRAVWSVVVCVALSSCGGGTGEEAPAAGGMDPAAPDAAAAPSGEYTRDSFVLCDAIEPHREELASIVGFEPDPERALSVMSSECVVRGAGGSFARVSLLPALVPSVALHVQSFDAEASAAPELGPDAMFVDDALQPHVAFAMGPLFIDVDAEHVETPSRETMIALALRVREILTEANS